MISCQALLVSSSGAGCHLGHQHVLSGRTSYVQGAPAFPQAADPARWDVSARPYAGFYDTGAPIGACLGLLVVIRIRHSQDVAPQLTVANKAVSAVN